METKFDPKEIFRIRKLIHKEVCNLPHHCNTKSISVQPTIDDYNSIEDKVKKIIAHELWEKAGKPEGNSIGFWKESEKIWNFCRHMWVDTLE